MGRSYSFLAAALRAPMRCCFCAHAASHSSRCRRTSRTTSWLGSMPSQTMKPRKLSSCITLLKAARNASGRGRPGNRAFMRSVRSSPSSYSPTPSYQFSTGSQPHSSNMLFLCSFSAWCSSMLNSRLLLSLQRMDQQRLPPSTLTGPSAQMSPRGFAARNPRRAACAGPSMPSRHFSGWQRCGGGGGGESWWRFSAASSLSTSCSFMNLSIISCVRIRSCSSCLRASFPSAVRLRSRSTFCLERPLLSASMLQPRAKGKPWTISVPICPTAWQPVRSTWRK
mmetsp:Transcript_44849/g.138846  ORF Transcript_44849/g.138846 Transcript_44849/m.138846 type:complete len:281 (+) Transcript_44849:521-1363(+)